MVLKLLDESSHFSFIICRQCYDFSKANIAEANVILKCLTSYSLWLSQCINHAKFAIFFGKNCELAVKAFVNSVLRLPPILASAKYLGIPLFILRKKKDSFFELKDRIFAKVTGWKAKLLYQAARTTLIKYVLNAIPTYVMSLFLIPKSLCTEIDSVLRKFWWGFPQEKKHNLHFLSWDIICKPKSLGGLGISSMEFINNSLLARLGWKLTSNEPLLWMEALKGKYLQNGFSFLEAPSNPLSSWIWKGLLKNRKLRWWRKVLAGLLLMVKILIFGLLLGFLLCQILSQGRMSILLFFRILSWLIFCSQVCVHGMLIF
jgi:hypothetical protein